MKDKTITTILDFKIPNQKEITKNFLQLSSLLDTEKLKNEANKVHATLIKMYNDIEKDMLSGKAINMENSSIVKGMDSLSHFLDKIRGKVISQQADVAVAEFDGKIKSAEERVKKAQDEIARIDAEINAKRASLIDQATKGGFGQKFSKDILDSDNLIKELNRVRDAIASGEKEGLKVDGLKKREAALIQLSEALQKVNKEVIALNRQKGGHSSQKTQGLSSLTALQGEKAKFIEENPSEIDEKTAAYKRFVQTLQQVREAYLGSQLENQVELNKKNTDEIKKATAANEKLNKEVTKTSKSFGRKILEGFSYYALFSKIKQLWSTSVEVIRNLDRAMVEAAIVTNMTTKETWQLLGSYQKLADVVGRSTSEIANLNAFFLQQGLTIKNAMEMTEIAAKSAAIAGISLQESANYLTSAINGFGLAASAAEDVADKFAAVGAATAADFEELAIAMSKVAPVAQSAGVGIDFMMGVLAKGIHATREAPENIGTAFKTIFARMSELTDIGKATEDGMSLNRVEKALASVGIALRDEMGQFRDLETVLYEVGYAWKDLDSIQQNYLATALAGTRQQPRLLAILNDFEETVEFIEISKNSAKAMEYQHMEYMDGMEAASQAVRNSWEGVVTSFLDSSAIITLLEGITVVLKTVANVIGFLNTGFGRFIALVGAVTTLLVIYKTYLGSTILSTITLSGANAALASSWWAVKTGIIKATKASIAFMIANWPLLAIAAAIALVVVGFSALSKEIKKQNTLIETNNKLMYESTQREKDLRKDIEEYKELSNQIHKTNEELERMKELKNELSEFDVADGKTENFMKRDIATGEWVIDEEKATKAYAKEIAKRGVLQQELTNKLKNQQFDNKRRAYNNSSNSYGPYDVEADISKGQEEIFEKFKENLVQFGIEAGEEISSGVLEGSQAQEFNQLFRRVMDNATKEMFLDENQEMTFEQAKKVGADISNVLLKAFEDGSKIPEDQLNTLDLLNMKMETYSKTIKEIEALGYSPETINDLKMAVDVSFSDEAALNLLKSRNVDLKIVADFIDSGGKIAQVQKIMDGIGLVEGAGDSDVQERQKADVKRAEEEKARLEAQMEYDAKHSKKWWKTRKQEEKALAAKNETNLKLIADQEKIINEAITDQQHALAKVGADDLLGEILSGENITENIQKMREALMSTGMSSAEANAFLDKEIFSNLEDTSINKISEYGKSINSALENALKLDADMLKGDFTSYLNLVDELGENGVDLVDAFLVSGDPTEIISEMSDKILKDIDRERKTLQGFIVQNAAEGSAEDKANKQYEKQLAALDIMESSYQNINQLTSIFNLNLEKSADLLKNATSYLKTYEELINAGFSENSPIVGFFKGYGDIFMSQAKDSSIKNVEMIFNNLESEVDRLKKSGYMDEDGNFLATPSAAKAKISFDELMKQAGEALVAASDIVMKDIEENNKKFADKIKESNDHYANLISSMKEYHSMRWNEVDYENKLIDLQKNIMDARNKLSAAQVGGTSKQIQDAQEALKRIQQERRKAIEEESMARLEKDLEKTRKEAEDKLEKEKLDTNKILIGSLDTLGDRVVSLNETLQKPVEVQPQPISVGGGSSRGSGGGRFQREHNLSGMF